MFNLTDSQGNQLQDTFGYDLIQALGTKITETQIIYTNSYNFIKSNKFGVSILFGIFDGTLICEGDYLVTPPINSTDNDGSFTKKSNTNADYFYVASMPLNSPILLVKCNRTLNISRPHGPSGTKGALGYAGSVPASEQALLSGVRASMLQGTKGETNPANLPLDIRQPWWVVLLPALPGVVIDTGDFIRDDLGRRYAISSAELTDLGWRLTASYERV